MGIQSISFASFKAAVSAGITYVGAGAFVDAITAITPALPAGTAENDILVMLCYTANGENLTATGYTAAGNTPQSNTDFGFRLGILWKRAGASESAPTTNDSGTTNAALIMGFRGCVTTGDPWDATSGSGNVASSTSIVVPGVTTTVANAMVVSVCEFYRIAQSTTNFSGGANGNLTDFTERIDVSEFLGPLDGGFGAWTGIKATAGATGNTTATHAASVPTNYWTGALIPA